MYYKSTSLMEISIALRNNTLDLLEYIAQVCDRIDTADKVVQSLLPEKDRKKRLLKEAQELLEKYPKANARPPLFGVLVGIKDMFRVDGFPTQAGSKLPPEVFAGEEAISVTKLKQAGALILGKTVSTEFAYFAPGPTRNPRNPEYTPGGSSSGSAAAVAMGLCPLALGTQTIASVIRPAAYCGVVGVKPSYGRISTQGVIPFSQSVDHVGFFTQDMAGATLAASVLIDEWDSNVRSTKPRICLPSDAFLVQADCDSYNRFYKKVDMLNANGYEVLSYPLLKDIKIINDVHRELIAAEFATNHKELYAQYAELYSQPSRELMEKGSAIKSAALIADKAIQKTYQEGIDEVMQREGIDLWICPSTTTPAPKGIEYTGNPLMSLPWTFMGLPSISIPVGKATNGLPLGMQLVAGFGKDEALMQYASELFYILSY
jgi:Asp-tRNA(Asn)/Glu-tRNA(Gln) amidotransferase A subunit family amidase